MKHLLNQKHVLLVLKSVLHMRLVRNKGYLPSRSAYQPRHLLIAFDCISVCAIYGNMWVC